MKGYPPTGCCCLLLSPRAATAAASFCCPHRGGSSVAPPPFPKIKQAFFTSDMQRSTMVHPSPSLLVVLDPGLDMVNQCLSPAFHTARLSCLRVPVNHVCVTETDSAVSLSPWYTSRNISILRTPLFPHAAWRPLFAMLEAGTFHGSHSL